MRQIDWDKIDVQEGKRKPKDKYELSYKGKFDKLTPEQKEERDFLISQICIVGFAQDKYERSKSEDWLLSWLNLANVLTLIKHNVAKWYAEHGVEMPGAIRYLAGNALKTEAPMPPDVLKAKMGEHIRKIEESIRG